MNIKQLINQIENADAGSPELDLDIQRALRGPGDVLAGAEPAEPMSTSVDTAIAIINELFPERPIGFLENYFGSGATCAGLIGDIKGNIHLQFCVVGRGKTPALAFCCAALFAKGNFEDPEP